MSKTAEAKFDMDEGWLSCGGCGKGFATLMMQPHQIKYCIHCGARLNIEEGRWVEKQGSIDEFIWVPWKSHLRRDYLGG